MEIQGCQMTWRVSAFKKAPSLTRRTDWLVGRSVIILHSCN